MVDGRAKGNRYENRICRVLSRWLLSGDWDRCPVYDLPLRRRSTSITPIEGFWHGHGDILHKPYVDNIPFAFECKDQEGWELDGLLANTRCPVWRWWEQAKEQAVAASLLPLLLFTRKRRKDYVMLDEEAMSCLQPKGRHGPVLMAKRPSGEAVGLLLLDDLVEVPRSLVTKLASKPRNTSKGSASKNSKKPSRGASRGKAS